MKCERSELLILNFELGKPLILQSDTVSEATTFRLEGRQTMKFQRNIFSVKSKRLKSAFRLKSGMPVTNELTKKQTNGSEFIEPTSNVGVSNNTKQESQPIDYNA